MFVSKTTTAACYGNNNSLNYFENSDKEPLMISDTAKLDLLIKKMNTLQSNADTLQMNIEKMRAHQMLAG